MAKNLRAKIPASDTLIVRDVNEDAAKRFVAEAQEAARSNGAGADEGRVEIAENAREVAEKSGQFNGFASIFKRSVLGASP
jgi:3-hydroxyisobutyrate dehydrogenase